MPLVYIFSLAGLGRFQPLFPILLPFAVVIHSALLYNLYNEFQIIEAPEGEMV